MTDRDKNREAIGLDLTKHHESKHPHTPLGKHTDKTWKKRKTVTIDRISNGGNPIAKSDYRGKLIHVPGAKTGETLEVAIEEDHGNFFKGFVIGPDGISSKQKEKKKQREKRKKKRRKREEKQEQEIEDWRERKEEKKQRRRIESGKEMKEIANDIGQCQSPQESNANEDRVTESFLESDREKEIREDVAGKHN